MPPVETVRQRAILYVPGFDPRGASTYHALTTRQFAAHCEATEQPHEISKRSRIKAGLQTWSLQTTSQGGPVRTEFLFLGWDDLVREFWVRPDGFAVIKGAWAWIRALGLGIPQHLARTSWPALITISAPLIQVASFALLATLLFLFVLVLAGGSYVPGLAGLILTFLAFLWCLRKLASFNSPWVGRILRFAVQASKHPILENSDAPRKMAEVILDALQTAKNDEILVVSHSIGAQIALMAMAEAISLDADGIASAVKNQRLTFVTLGQVIPLMSWSSKPITAALKTVGDSSIPWLDISAPSDPACFALVDPVRDRFGGAQRVHVQNARLYLGFKGETFQAAKADRFTMHFLYLMTPDGDREKGFDFYDLMTSPQLLASRLDATPKTVHPHFAKA